MKTLSDIVNVIFMPPHRQIGAYSFWSVRVSVFSFVRLFASRNFYIGHSFLMVSNRAFIFDICLPLCKPLSLVPKSRSSVKVKYQGHSFLQKMAVAAAFIYHKHNLFLFKCDLDILP